LGSLDPLDPTEQQILYPELYQPETDIFWKQEGKDNYVENYYLRARIERLRQLALDPFERLGITCMLFSSISMQADLACVAANIPPPDLGFLLVRYAIRVTTTGIVLARGGGVAGKLYWKNADTLVGVDVKSKEWMSNFEAWMACGITDPTAVTFVPNVFPAGQMDGYDTSIIDTNFDFGNITSEGLSKSMLVMYVGSEFTREQALSEANPLPLSGRFDMDYLGNPKLHPVLEQKITSRDQTPWPGFWYYNAMHNLSALHDNAHWCNTSAAKEAQSSHRYIPGITFAEQYYTQDSNGDYTIIHHGTGHTAKWTDDVRAVIEGRAVFDSDKHL